MYRPLRDSLVKVGRLGEDEEYLEKPSTADHLVSRMPEMLHDRSAEH